MGRGHVKLESFITMGNKLIRQEKFIATGLKSYKYFEDFRNEVKEVKGCSPFLNCDLESDPALDRPFL